MMSFKILLIYILINLTKEDIYLHNPRGSNNRLNEQSAARTNGNRLFDSENNDRGGYNVGDSTNTAAKTEQSQYQMRYFQSGLNGKSYLHTEWTEQHGCGGNEDNDPTKQNCVLVLQYMCQDAGRDSNDLDRLRDGLNTNRQEYTNMQNDDKNSHTQRKTNNVALDRGLQETWEWYDKCNYRERNKNLFIADQNLGNNNKGYSSAVFTRQNANGNRNGYECPEERDYYPYWHPNPWKDIAILTSNTTLCDKLYNKNSFNIQPYYECVHLYDDQTRKHWSRYNNENDCKNNSGIWKQFYNYLEKAPNFNSKTQCEAQSSNYFTYKWALPYDAVNINQEECLVLLKTPVCQQAAWSRSNHLGNSRDGNAPNFKWELPYFPSKIAKKCVFRIRYNITTDDYDPFGIDAASNKAKSPIQTNPLVDVGVPMRTLRLAINTAQYGRVFQDRSHSFFLLPRTKDINDNAIIYNLNVRGKRGNIVQTYPAVEYDFIPNSLELKTDNLLHIQWTGSNTHNNGQPSGDGQAGNDGNGQAGTDRNNFVEVNTLNNNYPLPFESTSIWNDIELIGLLNMNFTDTDANTYLIKSSLSPKDLALYFASSGYYQCKQSSTTCTESYDKKQLLDSDLNNAPASVPGALIRFKNSQRSYNYLCSRNNNFSNRSQKGAIIVL